MNEQQGLGGLLSPVDYRDGIASANAAPLPFLTLPEKLNTKLGPVMHQRKIPSCVAHSVVEIMKLYFFKKTGQWIDLSPRFLDIMAKRFDGQERNTGGTYPRLVMKLVTKYGCCTTKMLPNNTSLPVGDYRNDDAITKDVLKEAEKYKIPGYINVPVDLYSLRRAMYHYGAVSSLFSVGSELWVPSWAAKDTVPLRTPKVIVSGHQMTTKGWDKDLNLLRNEWSADWADKGETKYDPTEWSPYLHEAWAIAEIPQDVGGFLQALPSPQDFHYVWNKNLKIGDFNEDVKFLQIAYMILGYLAPIKSDELGYFGPKTAAANLRFQAASRIAPQSANDFGPRSRAALGKIFSI